MCEFKAIPNFTEGKLSGEIGFVQTLFNNLLSNRIGQVSFRKLQGTCTFTLAINRLMKLS